MNRVSWISFLDAFGRDVNFHGLYPQAGFLDIETEDAIWIFEEDRDAEMAAALGSELGSDHGEHLTIKDLC